MRRPYASHVTRVYRLIFAALAAVTIVALSLGYTLSAHAQETDVHDNELAIDQITGRYDSFLVESNVVGERYRIQVSLPLSYALSPETSFRVVYLTDADLLFGAASEIAFLAETDFLDLSTEPSILVGVGYEDPAEWPHKRTRDFSPVDSIDPQFLHFTEQMLGLPAETGGADAFLTFLEDELHPIIADRYRVQGDTATLMTNSQGGVFGFYAFLQDSPLFDRYWIGSPAIFGRGTYLLDQLSDRLEQGFDRPTRVFMSLGAFERTLSLNGSMPMEMHQLSAFSYSSIVSRMLLVDDDNITFEAIEFEGETHNSVVTPAMGRAYRFLQDRNVDQ